MGTKIKIYHRGTEALRATNTKIRTGDPAYPVFI
jgi:hypothetical protein